MVFRNLGNDRNEELEDEDEDGLNVISDEDEEDEQTEPLFAAGQLCDLCETEEGRVGLDPTCRGNYGGDMQPQLFGYNCLADGRKRE